MANTDPEPEPIYCKKCGGRLAPNNVIVGYDEFTGEPLRPFVGQKVCQSKTCREFPRTYFEEILQELPGLEGYYESRRDKKRWGWNR